MIFITLVAANASTILSPARENACQVLSYLLFNNVSSDILDGLMVRLLAVWLWHWVYPLQHRAEGLQHVQPLWRQTGLRGQLRWGLASLSSGWIFLHFIKKFHKCLFISTCQVYSSDVTSVAVLFTLLLMAMLLFIYVTKRQILVIKFYGKSKLLEMHMNSVHKIEMK